MLRSTRIWRATGALIILAVAACSSATEPAAVPNLSVLVGATDGSDSGASPIVVNGNDVVFRGAMATPCLSYSIRSEARNSADGYLITLRGKQAGEMCALAIGRYSYIGTLWDLPSGNPRVIVRHMIDDANWPVDTVIDTRVVIP